MYTYQWDAETGGLLLTSSPQSFSKEPRPVYYKELDILGFDKYWNYAKNDAYPYMWAEANNYFYRGRLDAKTKGGTLYAAPEIILVENPEPDGKPLRFIDIPAMAEKNKDILEKLTGETIKKIYNTYVEYTSKVDVFYVAFSGGKDSVVALDLVQRSLPHNKFKVLFGDTQMEFPDTYEVIAKVEEYCQHHDIQFYRAKSGLRPDQTWLSFGPPAVTNRWCCSVHKTSPQIVLLQEITGQQGFTGMAFTGIRAEESTARSEYDDISFGKKNRGQFSCHPILEWNSAELFLYIFSRNLVLNEAYKKGNTRAGCLVCPMSSGKHEYMKHVCYKDDVDKYIEYIKKTSGKTSFSEIEMSEFIENGNWKTRKTGRELNFGSDLHIVDVENGKTTIRVLKPNPTWKIWAKTLGEFIEINSESYTIDFAGKAYIVKIKYSEDGSSQFTFPNCGTSKEDIKFISLFRSVIIKSLYCTQCGVCAANCSAGCIDMKNGLHISDQCRHCLQCHDIHEHCLRYNSIRNKNGGERKMKGLDRYFSFGTRKTWMDIYFKYEGSDEFWNTDGNGEVPNKKKDAFLNFVKDAGLVTYDKSRQGDKYTKNVPNEFARKLFSIGSASDTTWALMLCNLVYTPQFNWYVKNLPFKESITLDRVKYLLESVMDNDAKGLGKRNICDALKMVLVKTPLGESIGLGHYDADIKVSATGNETITLKSFYRTGWGNPDSIVILYSLYKFAEACGNYYQFTLTRLLNHDIDSDGVSPTEIFGIERDQMEKLLNGLAINYPDYITTGFTLDLDNITLNSTKTSADVLKLF